MRLRVGIALAAGTAVALATGFALRSDKPAQTPAATRPPVQNKPDASVKTAAEDEEKSPTLRPPTGKLASLTCASAAAIVAEVRHELAFTPLAPTSKEFASATKDWIDPHGHWAVTSDATPFASVDANAGALLAEIADGGKCAAALRIGRTLAAWVDAERTRYDLALGAAPGGAGDETRALAEALDVATHDAGPHDLTAASLTNELAERACTLSHAFGAPLEKYLQAARNRFFPELTAEAWSEIVLGAAVRAWVEQVDAHGAWAPYGEEAVVHDVDLDQDAPSRLWGRATRTLLGVRIEEGALAPLAVGDVVLDVDGLFLAGLAVEQLDELALTATDAGQPFDVVVMREGERVPRVLRVDPDTPAPPAQSAHPFDLATETIPYGAGEVALVTIPDVYDDLGELFARALVRIRSPKLVGVVLDLRGDGGGSTEGAIDTLGVFLPGARLFPMRSRSGAIDVDRAPDPPADEQWTGPVATLIDSGTASAAEMLAGALAAYRRGPSIGAPTYGKGCAQEYLDDDAHAGLLRMTTLLFALPDGSPVQRVGLTPTIGFPFRGDLSGDREAKLLHSPASWTGPDVRDRVWLAKSAQFAWPPSGGAIGPCKEDHVCKALQLAAAEPKHPHAEARRAR